MRLLTVLLFFLLSNMTIHADGNSYYKHNRPPLQPKTFCTLPLGNIKAEGWLKEQLLRQKNGLTGHLDVIYEPVMGKRNGWLGGDGDQWERGPYWIDGLLPLAYQLNDKELQDKARLWVEWAIKSQQPNGYFGPEKDYPNDQPGLQRDNAKDWWPKMVVLKVLQQYYMATEDNRVLTLFDKYFKYQLRELSVTPLNHWSFWGEERGGDNLQVILWFYNQTGHKYLLELAELLNSQTTDWAARLNSVAFLRPWSTHCVNIAQGTKQPIIYGQLHRLDKAVSEVKNGLAILRTTYGQAHGLWGADEWLHNANPTQGSELCTIVEMMFSLESIIEITGDVEFADYLEKLAFNPLQSQISDEFDTRQYFQQANQVEITRHPRNFNVTYEGTAQLFGVLTGYACCTSNMHQGWPKFVQNLWYGTASNGLAALVYSPCTVTTTVEGNKKVTIAEETNYPFDENIKFTVTFDRKHDTAEFPLYLRIPSWCNNASLKVNGKNVAVQRDQNSCLNRIWRNGDIVELTLPMHITIERGFENSAWVERGPLVYALKMEENWNKVASTDFYGSYYEVTSTSDWNYALLGDNIYNPETGFKVIKNPVTSNYPWNPENCPLELKTTATPVKEWTLYNHSAGLLPFSPYYQMKEIDPKEITLIPYGCTTLRISQFPVWDRGFRND